MQTTEKYQLNLIDPSDDFSPEPLNENARTVDAKLQTLETGLGSGGKTARIAYGSYVGTGISGKENHTVLTFDFKPLFLGVMMDSTHYLLMLRGCEGPIRSGSDYPKITWSDNSVSWYNDKGDSGQCNLKGQIYHWVAIGESL